MTHIVRLSRVTQHFLAFVLHFAHGGFVMAGVLVVGLGVYQLSRFGSDGISPRAMFGYQTAAAAENDAVAGLVDVAYAESLPEQADLSSGLERVSAVIAKRHRVSPTVVESLAKLAQREGKRAGLDPLLILAVITVESGFNPFSESVLGAQGLMQIIPRFHTDKISSDKGDAALFEPAENIRVGALILKAYVRSTGNLEAALQMYAGASGDVEMAYSVKVMQELDRLRQAAGLASTSRTAARGKLGLDAS